MKREEMVLKIAESLVEPSFPDDVWAEASHILSRLEKSGMLPPTAFAGQDWVKIKSDHDGSIIQTKLARDVNLWQPDDETT